MSHIGMFVLFIRCLRALFVDCCVASLDGCCSRGCIYIGHLILKSPDHTTDCHIILTITLIHAIMPIFEAIRHNKPLSSCRHDSTLEEYFIYPTTTGQRKHTAEPARTRPKQSKHSKYSKSNTSYEIHSIPFFPLCPNRVNSAWLSGMAVVYRKQGQWDGYTYRPL